MQEPFRWPAVVVAVPVARVAWKCRHKGEPRERHSWARAPAGDEPNSHLVADEHYLRGPRPQAWRAKPKLQPLLTVRDQRPCSRRRGLGWTYTHTEHALQRYERSISTRLLGRGPRWLDSAMPSW